METSQQTALASKPDTINQDIYDFMKLMIVEQGLDLRNGLSLEPENSCTRAQSDEDFLNTLLIEQKKPIAKVDTGDLMNRTVTVNVQDIDKCLTKEDVKSMLAQKDKHFPQELKLRNGELPFRWDNSRLGFDLTNDRDWYAFSVPLFSEDKTKAIMMIRSLCPGLCGSGKTVLFRKQNGKWKSQTGGQWIH